MRSLKVLLLSVGVVSLVGCASVPRTVLDVPPEPTAEFRKRGEAFDRLRAVEATELHITEYRGAQKVGSYRRMDHLRLNNGVKVYHPSDLMPVVGEASVAGGHIRTMEKHQSRASMYAWFAAGGILGGPALFLGSIGSENMNQWMIAGASATALGLVAAILSAMENGVANHHREEAFYFYNQSLATRLDVCTRKDVLVPCGESSNESMEAAEEARQGDDLVELGD